MALVDSNYCFLFADVGCQGRISDGGVSKNSILWNKMINNSLGLPTPIPLPIGNGNVDKPYVFLGDTAFALHRNLMKPYLAEYEEGTFDIFNGDILVSRGSWRDDVPINPALRDMRNIPRRSPRNAEQIRNEFATYLHTRQRICNY
ncbi:hypothetical protein ACJJTC_017052 [Scirpophaga incertulas]